MDTKVSVKNIDSPLARRRAATKVIDCGKKAKTRKRAHTRTNPFSIYLYPLFVSQRPRTDIARCTCAHTRTHTHTHTHTQIHVKNANSKTHAQSLSHTQTEALYIRAVQVLYKGKGARSPIFFFFHWEKRHHRLIRSSQLVHTPARRRQRERERERGGVASGKNRRERVSRSSSFFFSLSKKKRKRRKTR